MSLTIELEPAEHARLESLAQQRGVPLQDFARELLGLSSRSRASQRMTDDEWEAIEAELAEGIDPAIPPLSDEAVSRCSIYGRRTPVLAKHKQADT